MELKQAKTKLIQAIKLSFGLLLLAFLMLVIAFDMVRNWVRSKFRPCSFDCTSSEIPIVYLIGGQCGIIRCAKCKHTKLSPATWGTFTAREGTVRLPMPYEGLGWRSRLFDWMDDFLDL